MSGTEQKNSRKPVFEIAIDDAWRPRLTLWPTPPEPRGWDKISTVDRIAAEYLVRMYTEYRDTRYNKRWWLRGKPHTQPWWPSALKTVAALREAGIPPVAWIAWVDGALWQGKGPPPPQMVFSAKLLAEARNVSWCQGTWQDYLPRHVQVPPSMKLVWAAWKKADSNGTLTDPTVGEHLRQLLQRAELEADDMQEHLHTQAHEGRWVW